MGQVLEPESTDVVKQDKGKDKVSFSLSLAYANQAPQRSQKQ
jgi:hypothetical protein